MSDSDVRFIVVTDGVWQERPRLDMGLVTRAVRDVPAWIRDRPFQGGAGAPHCCEPTDTACIFRRVIQRGAVQRAQAVMDDASAHLRASRLNYTHDPGTAEQAMNRIREYMRMAYRCPTGQLDGLYDRLVVQAEVYRTLAMIGVGAHTGALASACDSAAHWCWERLIAET